jgi:hypothetical protein
MVINWLSPSNLSNVLGACDPAPLVQRNFELIAAHLSIALPAVDGPGIDLEADEAAAAVQANFDAIAAAMGLTFSPVAGAADPEVCAQSCFESINANW